MQNFDAAKTGNLNWGNFVRITAKPEKVCPIQLFLMVAAPWGRGDLSAAAGGYSISGFAMGRAETSSVAGGVYFSRICRRWRACHS